MTVYVAHEQGHDMTSATQFGEIQILFDNRTPEGDRVPYVDPKEMVASMIASMPAFTDDDYILAVGDPLAIGAAVALAADMNEGRVKVLRFERFSKRYEPYQLDLAADCYEAAP